MNMTSQQLQQIIEAALMVAGRPLTVQHLQKLFDENDQPETGDIRAAIAGIREQYQLSGIELKEVASGFQFQARTEFSPWLCKLWEERPARYSRALLETLALIAYRQPITRAEVEEIRGVTASSHIIKTLLEREWIKVMGYRDVPGKPAIYGTTKAFLDYFNLKSLDDLPTLAEIKDLESQEAKLQVQLELDSADTAAESATDSEDRTDHNQMITDESADENSTEKTESAAEEPAEATQVTTETLFSEESSDQIDIVIEDDELVIEETHTEIITETEENLTNTQNDDIEK